MHGLVTIPLPSPRQVVKVLPLQLAAFGAHALHRAVVRPAVTPQPYGQLVIVSKLPLEEHVSRFAPLPSQVVTPGVQTHLGPVLPVMHVPPPMHWLATVPLPS